MGAILHFRYGPPANLKGSGIPGQRLHRVRKDSVRFGLLKGVIHTLGWLRDYSPSIGGHDQPDEFLLQLPEPLQSGWQARQHTNWHCCHLNP